MKADLVLRKMFGHSYLYTSQRDIIKALDDRKSDIFCCSPRFSGVKTAVIAHSISSSVKTIFIIRSIKEIDTLHNLLSETCKIKALSVTSKISLNERITVFKDFFEGDTLFLITTPDQFRILKDHLSIIYNCTSHLLVSMFDCEKVFPESHHHHVSYTDSIKIIHSLQSSFLSKNQSKSRMSTLFVSNCLSFDEFKEFKHSSRPAKFIHSQLTFGDLKLVCTSSPAGSNDALKKLLSSDAQSTTIIHAKPISAELVRSIRASTTLTVYEDSEFKEIVQPCIFVTSNLNCASQVGSSRIINIGIPENTSYLTYLLAHALELSELHYLFSHEDIRALQSLVTANYPCGDKLEPLIQFLCQQKLLSSISQKQIDYVSSTSKLEPAAVHRFMSLMAERGYIKKVYF